MKTIILNILIVTAVVCVSCSGQPGFAQQPKTVHAYAPEMNNMEMLSMTQLPGWQLLAGTQWIGGNFCNSIKGVNESLNASFYYDGDRHYVQSSTAQSGTTDGKSIYLNLMSAADYLDYVFHRQFPNLKGAKRTMLKTLDQYSAADRQQVEEHRIAMYNDALLYMQQTATGQYSQLRAQTIDRASAEYKWVQDGDTIIHFIEVLINASYVDVRSPYLNSSTIYWGQEWLMTVTTPTKNSKKAGEDFIKMIMSAKFNDAYIASLGNMVMERMRRTDADSRRIMNEMTQAEIRHQQQMMQIIQETNDYVRKTQQEVFANRQASQERINQGWRDAIVGVDRYMGTDGKVVEVPVSMGNKVWQSAEGGTIYTSDSYLFRAIDNLPDKDGIERQFRLLQLMK